MIDIMKFKGSASFTYNPDVDTQDLPDYLEKYCREHGVFRWTDILDLINENYYGEEPTIPLLDRTMNFMLERKIIIFGQPTYRITEKATKLESATDLHHNILKSLEGMDEMKYFELITAVQRSLVGWGDHNKKAHVIKKYIDNLVKQGFIEEKLPFEKDMSIHLKRYIKEIRGQKILDNFYKYPNA